MPFLAPLLLGLVVYLVTLGPVLRRHGGDNQDLAFAVRRSVDLALTDDFEVLLLGNSRVVRGVDPRYLARRAHNFAFDDDTFLYYLHKVRFLRRQGKRPTLALVGVDVFQLAYWNYDRYFAYREIFDDPDLDAWAYDGRFGPTLLANVAEKKASLRFAYRSALVSLALRRPPAASFSPETYELEPSGYYRVTYAKPRKLDREKMPKAGRDPRAVALLEQTVAELRKDGADVVLFTPPASAAFVEAASPEERERFAAEMRAMSVRHGARYESWERAPGFEPADFPDEVHLSVDGAARFSRMLSEWVETHVPRRTLTE